MRFPGGAELQPVAKAAFKGACTNRPAEVAPWSRGSSCSSGLGSGCPSPCPGNRHTAVEVKDPGVKRPEPLRCLLPLPPTCWAPAARAQGSGDKQPERLALGEASGELSRSCDGISGLQARV